MSPRDIPIARLDGTPATFGEIAGAGPTLVVNVASKCGFTPQYAALEALHEKYSEQGLTVVGVPCNQFGGQEPGTADEIAEFCSTTYGVTFPLTEKVEVNGEGRHPLYAALVDTADEKGRSGDVDWNFEKFLLDADGTVVGRWSTRVEPDDARIVDAIEDVLAR
ncbi:MAG: glutathione peroxidase [Nocardioides sp.]